MKYIESLSRLANIIEMKMANETSELVRLEKKKINLETTRAQLQKELHDTREYISRLVKQPVTKIYDYYKIRSSISAFSSKATIIESKIASANDDIEDILVVISNVNERISFLRKKKKKYERLLSNGL